ncbi:hypothetical protein QTP86_019440 [Hemibagrus guttatus]|nr:hypothetical protein QTP86_019440 [Hemibagrus guttatus]
MLSLSVLLLLSASFCGVGGVELTQTSSVLVKPGESFSISYVHGEELTQPASMTVQPGQSLSIHCKGFIFSNGLLYSLDPTTAGKTLEWIGYICGSGGTGYSDKLKNKFSISRDTSTNTITIGGQNMQTEDTAVYYCARDPQ